MIDKEFVKKYEEFLDKGYCNCNEMNCIDNNSPRRILNIVKRLQLEENKILRENAEHNDKVVDKVNWENMLLKKENKQLKEQLETSEKARKSGIDYLTSYESISTIQSLDNTEQNKGLDEKTMNEMIRRYSVVHDEVLKMLDIKDSDK